MFYTYKILFEDGYYYLGRRLCPDGMTPEEDDYYGSPVTNCEYWNRGISFKKMILETNLTKKEAEIKEDMLIGDLFKTDPLCLNASPANNFSNAGSKWYNNGVEQGMFFENKVPEGWVEGRLGTAAKGKKYYTNGKESKMFFEGEQPKDWVRGNHSSQDKNKNPFFSKTHNKGKIAYHKDDQVAWFFEGQQPEGWQLGHTDSFRNKRSKKYKGSGNPNFGKRDRKFFNNGEVTKLFVPGKEPKGWKLGMLRKNNAQ
jgi:hypothetical protein